MWVPVPPVEQWIFLPESTSSADCLTVSLQPPWAIVCIDMRAHVKNPKHWQLHHCLDMRKYSVNTLVGMGGAALAAAVLYPGKAA